jgi:hypothetical protein
MAASLGLSARRPAHKGSDIFHAPKKLRRLLRDGWQNAAKGFKLLRLTLMFSKFSFRFKENLQSCLKT